MRVGIAALGSWRAAQHFDAVPAARGIQPVWLEHREQQQRAHALPALVRRSTRHTSRRARPRIRCTRLRGAPTTAWTNSSSRRRSTPSAHQVDAVGIRVHEPRRAHEVITMQLFGERRTHTFYFLLDVPGISTDYHHVNFDALYPRTSSSTSTRSRSCDAALERFPRYTTRRNGSGRGDALNFVLIGTTDEIGGTLVSHRAGTSPKRSRLGHVRTFKSFALRRALPLLADELALRVRAPAGRRLPEGARLHPPAQPPAHLARPHCAPDARRVARRHQPRHRRLLHQTRLELHDACHRPRRRRRARGARRGSHHIAGGDTLSTTSAASAPRPPSVRTAI